MSAQRPWLKLEDAVKASGVPQEEILFGVEARALRSMVVGTRPRAGLRIDAAALRDFAERWRAGERVVRPVGQSTCGVYLLFAEREIVYVGRSSTIASRLATHYASGRAFDTHQVIPCDLEQSVWLERELIRTLKPVQNRVRYKGHAARASAMLRGSGIR